MQEIQDIMGFPLPKSARKYRPWWANDKTHVQANDGWLNYGWKVKEINFSNETIIFVKNKSFEDIKNNKPSIIHEDITPYEFEEIARIRLSKFFSTSLSPGKVDNIPKLFDLVSNDSSIVGDAKLLTMVRGSSIPPAKFSTIAEYVWLLEKTTAKKKFLVFGKDKRVPYEWLKRYGSLNGDVDFYFIDSKQNIEKLNER